MIKPTCFDYRRLPEHRAGQSLTNEDIWVDLSQRWYWAKRYADALPGCEDVTTYTRRAGQLSCAIFLYGRAAEMRRN